MSGANPEELARRKIDKLLTEAGWNVQDREAMNRTASLGVAVREFPTSTGPCDYLLFVDGKAAGVIEAKPAGTTLSGFASQSGRYLDSLPDYVAKWRDKPVMAYESTGDETFFRDQRDPKPRSRRVFAFHKPETLKAWLLADATLRQRLDDMPVLDNGTLRKCQIDAIHGLERSLADDKPRSLIQMATGAGKTFTACTFSWRLLKHANASRILFLVDRNNLGEQTLKEYQNFLAPGAANRFSDTYIVQQPKSNRIDPDAKVVITTIQRLYAMLRGEEPPEDSEERSSFEVWDDEGNIRPVVYNAHLPIEHFDFIVIDECHRSIYGVWRQVLEYFDAYLLGLTATPSKKTLGFFKSNLVAEYPYEQSVVDGVNVGYEIFSIRTRVTTEGGKVDSGYTVPFRDRRTRALRYEQLDDELEYKGQDLDRSVTVPDQIRAVLQCFRDKLFTDLFTGRSGEWVPKTLIFAKDDNHAEEIVRTAREVFNEGDDFAKKITYQAEEKPKELIQAFRNDAQPRIAVTVDMIATGTDIRPIECVIFMRDVKSEGYYEQMKGRGVRTISDADLHQVTPDAKTKTRFVLIDAVGVTETKKSASQPLERKRGVSFEKLIEQIAQGRRDEDAVSSLAGRLAALDRQIEPEDQTRITTTAGGITLRQLAHRLLDSVDPDMVEAEVQNRHGEAATAEQAADVANELKDTACQPLDNPELRRVITSIKKKTDILIDEWTADTVVTAEYDHRQAEERIASFKTFLDENKDELLALQILYSQPYSKRQLTYASIKELAERLTDPPYHLTTADIWQAYRRIDASRVNGTPSDKMLTDIISLVRFATAQVDTLEPYDVRVRQRFNLWIGRQKKAGREFSTPQMDWLEAIRDYLAANVEIDASDLMKDQPFSAWGGVLAARQALGNELSTTLTELRGLLAA